MADRRWFEYRTGEALNLHHVLYAEAWRLEAHNTGVVAKSQIVEGDLAIRSSDLYAAAVAYYRSTLIQRDLLFDTSMRHMSSHLVGRDGHVPHEWVAVFDPLLRTYVTSDWPRHRATNLAWTAEVAEQSAKLLPLVMPRLESLFRLDFPDSPMLVSTVIVGRTGPAYTQVRPTHITCSTTHRKSQGLAAVEIAVHEACHAIAEPLSSALAARIAPQVRQGSELWHVVLFYLAGEVVARTWDRLGIRYQPYIDATGLFQRAWPQFEHPVREAWSGYLDGTSGWSDCCDRLAAAVNL